MERHRDPLPLCHTLALPTYGLVSRSLLRIHGIDRHAIRRLTTRGDLEPCGIHALRVPSIPWDPIRSLVVAAVMNSGSSAWADGVAALVMCGLTGHPLEHVDVGVPENASSRGVAGVRRHRLRTPPPLRCSPVPHAEPEQACLHAVSWSASDLEATRIIVACLGQDLVTSHRLSALALSTPQLFRRALVDEVLHDLATLTLVQHEIEVASARIKALSAPLPADAENSCGGGPA